MGRFVEVADRQQASFLPACLEDNADADNPVRTTRSMMLPEAGARYLRTAAHLAELQRAQHG